MAIFCDCRKKGWELRKEMESFEVEKEEWKHKQIRLLYEAARADLTRDENQDLLAENLKLKKRLELLEVRGKLSKIRK